MKFKNCVRLRGLDKSNYLAEARGILIHSAGKVTRFSGEKEYIPLGTESRGCFTVSRSCVEKVMQIYKGEVADTVYQLCGGLRSGMGYCGCGDIPTLQKNGKFVRITGAGLAESHPHDVEITKEAPNYSK